LKTILVTSQKGGSGKTTLTAHLAVEAERVGDAPAWIIDTDHQGTLSNWHERRKAETPARGECRLEHLKSALENLNKNGAALCFIDTAPTISDQTATLISMADLVVIPVRPSPNDLWSVTETVDLVKAQGKPFIFVITQAKPQASITAQVVAVLSSHGPVSAAFITDRVIYAASMTGGDTASEIAPKGPAAEEIAALWENLKSAIPEIPKSRTKKVAHA
jgi:chromosome partitioning protein